MISIRGGRSRGETEGFAFWERLVARLQFREEVCPAGVYRERELFRD